jgi:hypothetical protein
LSIFGPTNYLGVCKTVGPILRIGAFYFIEIGALVYTPFWLGGKMVLKFFGLANITPADIVSKEL